MSSVDDKLKELYERVAQLEEWAHPAKDLKEFGDYIDIDERIKRLEELWEQQEKK